jgi:hypothetical protein
MMASSGFIRRAGESKDDLTVVAIRMTWKRYAPAREVAEYLGMVS